MLWSIDNSDTYLLASIHAMDSEPFQLSTQSEEAYSRSKRIAFESDFTLQPDLTPFQLPESRGLSTQVKPQLLKAIRRRTVEAGLARQQIEGFQPWFAALRLTMMLAARKGITVANGVDIRLLNRATSDKLQIVTLEDHDVALKAFAAAPLFEQIYFLSRAAEETEICLAEIETMVSALRAGLEKPFEDIIKLRKTQTPIMFDALVRTRSEAWAPKIASMADDRVPTLVCVGALHCVGSDGLPALLQQLGHSISRVD